MGLFQPVQVPRRSYHLASVRHPSNNIYHWNNNRAALRFIVQEVCNVFANFLLKAVKVNALKSVAAQHVVVRRGVRS